MTGVLEEGRALLAALEAYVKRSEERQAYREDHGRGLSKDHQQQLADILKAVGMLRERLLALTAPAVTPEELRASYERVKDQLAHLEGDGK